MSDLIVVLDIGTAKVVALAGELDFNGELKVIAMSEHPNNGIESGMVIDIKSCVNAITAALDDVQKIADCDVHSVFINITGSHISGINSDGAVPIQTGEVTKEDLDRVLEAARARVIPANQKILHVLPQDYVIDNQGGIKEPLGFSGVRLEAQTHLVTCATNAAQNLEKCVQRCNVSVEAMILSQLAAAEAVLTEDEKELGVCLIDIGAGTTDIAVFTQGAIRHTAVIPMAGRKITREIATGLRTSRACAEDVKTRYACALSAKTDISENITVSGIGNRQPYELSRQILAEIVESCYKHILGSAYEELRRNGFLELIASGIVLTGGTAVMEGSLELAENIFQLPVRLGVPNNIRTSLDSLIHSRYSTTVGLLQYAAKTNASFITRSPQETFFTNPKENLMDELINEPAEPEIPLTSKVVGWFKDKL